MVSLRLFYYEGGIQAHFPSVKCDALELAFTNANCAEIE